jgi:hypothetical protein
VWLFLYTLRERSFFSASLVGFCLGLATLFRVISVGLLLIFIGFILFFHIRKHYVTFSAKNLESKENHFFKLATIIVTFFILTIAPWVFRNTLIYGRPVLLTIQGWGSMIDGG